jgi:hypothetical protein
VNTDYDPANCGSCGNDCGSGAACYLGSCISVPLSFSGIAYDLPKSDVINRGWTLCYNSLYSVYTDPSGVVLPACTGSELMLACAPLGASNLTIAAHAPRTDVLFECGVDNTTHEANGVAWYFNDNYSWGFTSAGNTVYRNSCDTDSGSDRLCWHTTVAGGYRCGSTTNLNSSTTWEKLVYER